MVGKAIRHKLREILRRLLCADVDVDELAREIEALLEQADETARVDERNALMLRELRRIALRP